MRPFIQPLCSGCTLLCRDVFRKHLETHLNLMWAKECRKTSAWWWQVYYHDKQPIFCTCSPFWEYPRETMTNVFEQRALYAIHATRRLPSSYTLSWTDFNSLKKTVTQAESCILSHSCSPGRTRAPPWSRSKKAYLLYFNRDSIGSSHTDLQDLEWWV